MAAAPTVLIGEDDEFLLQLMKLALTMEGFRVEVARDGPSALALARIEKPDLTVLDIGLPGATGCDVLRALRNGEQTRSLPVALMSGGPDEPCPSEGAQAFVRKPFALSSLVSTVKHLLA